MNWTNPDSAYDAVLASQPLDGESYDGSFANIARNADGYVHMTYQRDFAPGTTLSGATNFPCEYGNNNEGSNDYIYVGIPVNDIPTGSWKTFEIPDFKDAADMTDPISQLRQEIKKTLDRRTFKDPSFSTKSKHITERIFTALSPFAKNVLSVLKQGSAVFPD